MAGRTRQVANRPSAPWVVLAEVRFVLIALVVCLLAACGGSGNESQGSAETQAGAQLPSWVKNALAETGGPDVAATMGSSDFAVGKNRVVFLVVREDGSLVQAPRGTVRFGTAAGRPGTTEAVLEPVGAHEHPGGEEVEPHDHVDATDVYIARVDVEAPGRYWFVVDLEGEELQAVGTLEVAEKPTAPAIGDKAIASDNPTLADASAAKITTARPPDTALLRHSIADSLADRIPFVAVFATPEFCVSRVCGPTVEVVQRVADKFPGALLRFIHVEIFTGNDPDKGYNRWVREWNLPTEPWIFVVDRGGVIRERFEGPVSVDELTESVSRNLGVAPVR
jgi:hypothetical protein